MCVQSKRSGRRNHVHDQAIRGREQDSAHPSPSRSQTRPQTIDGKPPAVVPRDRNSLRKGACDVSFDEGPDRISDSREYRR